MALVNPGLGEQIIECVTQIRAMEAEAEDDSIDGATAKAMLSANVIVIASALARDDGTNALDYEDVDRSAEESYHKRNCVGMMATLLQRLQAEPVRTWPEVDTLAGLLDDLHSTEDLTWRREIVRLGDEEAITVERAQTVAGSVSFETPEGTLTADLYEARSPDVVLNGAPVYLLEAMAEEGAEAPTGRYALMVDDPWWGRRIQPAAFVEGPLSEEFTMGYRLKGRILEDGTPVEGANVSLELELQTVEDGPVICWDSVEYNELVWDSELETWVEGAQVLAPIRTDLDGRWETIVPKGDGAIYQRAGDRRDDTPQTAARRLARHVDEVRCAWQGRKVALSEGEEAVLDVLSGTLEVRGEPGTTVLVGMLDDPGSAYTIPAGGAVTLTGLPEAGHSVVACRLTSWGTWDQSYGCARQIAQVRRGESTSVDLGSMEHYTDPNLVAGRVYERPGVPASGIEIVAIDTMTYELVGTIATTDGDGYWEAVVPPEGLGGQPAIHDPVWGSLPVLGWPYSDVVLGARAYSSSAEDYKPEAWRRPLRGHKNFQFCPGSVEVRDAETGEAYATEETAYGGWVTAQTLPKFKYVADLEELVEWGAQARQYDIVVDGEVVDPSFELRGQPFDDTGSGAGEYRAAGYSPEFKMLLGGKVRGHVLSGRQERVNANLPEAARVGLEFGEHRWFVEARAVGGEQVRSALSGSICPYCGGPVHRGPSGQFLRGYCTQCAGAFGRGDAMDARGYFETPTLPKRTEPGYDMRIVRISERDGCWSRRLGCHWRPDLYDESDAFITQSGSGQPTNAPRWVARHVSEFGDGLGFGRFDGDLAEPWVPGHDVAWFEALPEVDRPLGLAAMKLIFPPGHVAPLTYTVEIDCVRVDGQIETRTVTIPAGTRGPDGDDEFGDAIPIVEGDLLAAEDTGSPYRDVGLYVAVVEVRLVDPQSAPGCEFTIVNDVPWLADDAGVPVVRGEATPWAVQIGARQGQPHLLDDAVGQLFLFYVREGNLWMRRRSGLPGEWAEARRITDGGDASEPSACKDGSGRLIVACGRDGGGARLLRSRDDGRTWEEIE